MSEAVPERSSFRDPSGFVFMAGGELFRQVNRAYEADYSHLMGSGLYAELTGEGLLVPHEEAEIEPPAPARAWKVIRPEPVAFVSYPYEWCFSQLKDAALLTLKVQKKALDRGMVLKDASAYNVQFRDAMPVLIDTLSFARYAQGEPWAAYRQFCQHFLAPLALMAMKDIRLASLLRIHMDGIPLDLAASMLPWRSVLRFGLLAHIHLQSISQRRFADKAVDGRRLRVSRGGLLGIVEGLESAVRNLKWRSAGTEWGAYYEGTNYTKAAFEHKKQLVCEFIAEAGPRSVWDLGANTGVFSRLASTRGIHTVSFDLDHAAVEKNYRECVTKDETNLLPLVMDLANPSSGLGWANEERLSLCERGGADALLALALVHHLAISNNLPLAKIAEFLSRLARYLIIEFVPKSDSQVKRLLRTREDIFGNYNQDSFEMVFSKFFAIKRRARIRGVGEESLSHGEPQGPALWRYFAPS